ncbi:MAG: HAMP domain-containing protein [Treponema sp.]|jgi:nitrogen fixation/metabolism regulation signal transduction histidine kinase|nr:HAMP domain-containing protein [Treponema sp.]
MKTVRIHPKNFFINLRMLILIYLLLCVLTIVFSRIYIIETLQEGSTPEFLPYLVFFTVPLILLIFLGVSVANLARDFFANRTGSRFQIHLFAYFIVVVIFAAVPVPVITTRAVYEILHYWQSINLEKMPEDAERLIMDNYAFHLERCESIISERSRSIDDLMESYNDLGDGGDWREELLQGVHRHIAEEELTEISEDLAAVQDFWLLPNGTWQNGNFLGNTDLEIWTPPGFQNGFVPREIPRDRDVIRYVQTSNREEPGYFSGFIRVISYSLGAGFDETVAAITEERLHLARINSLGSGMNSLLLFFYGMFFFPILLMTAIIAISLSRQVSQPLVELAEATRRVAAGDFSIQILARQKDELGVLIRSFNTMVQDLQKSQNALVKAEKISIWQTIAQQLAHEIKNPLTPIKLSAERVLRRWQGSPDRIGEILESSMMAIIQEVQGLSDMLTEFRTLSRPIEPSQTWTVFMEAVQEIIAPYQTFYPKVVFDLVHIDPTIQVKMDSRHLNQVLTNLIINAIDAMDQEGTIEIRTDLVKKREARFCRLSLKDTGKGISPENRRKIFTPYFTTKESGTGLGLPIIERIINDHNGAIWLNSAEGAGTTFFIDFPLDEVTGNTQGITQGSNLGGIPGQPPQDREVPHDQNTDY